MLFQRRFWLLDILKIIRWKICAICIQRSPHCHPRFLIWNQSSSKLSTTSTHTTLRGNFQSWYFVGKKIIIKIQCNIMLKFHKDSQNCICFPLIFRNEVKILPVSPKGKNPTNPCWTCFFYYLTDTHVWVCYHCSETRVLYIVQLS